MKRSFALGLILLIALCCLVSCSQSLPNMDDAVGKAILEGSGLYAKGETATEGHIILDTVRDNGLIKVYAIASYGEFGFENGVFTKVSGSGAIPTVITFSLEEYGDYALLEYREPMDGEYYRDSIKEMFPRRLHRRALSADIDYPALAGQQEVQAREYLKSIGREARVSADYVEKELADINVEASNKLFADMASNDPLLNNCPYWLGTKELIMGGVRYIYETSQSKSGDGYDLITFQKKNEDGTVLEEKRYKIMGNEPQLLDGGKESLAMVDPDAGKPVVYKNTRYGFTFSLPESWGGFTIVTEKWEGTGAGASQDDPILETGDMILIRHPRWTPGNPRQDIPIMVFIVSQWAALQQEKFRIGAAPIAPQELARNSKYVFALPARYNYTFPTGYEEVENILKGNPLQANE